MNFVYQVDDINVAKQQLHSELEAITKAGYKLSVSGSDYSVYTPAGKLAYKISVQPDDGFSYYFNNGALSLLIVDREYAWKISMRSDISSIDEFFKKAEANKSKVREESNGLIEPNHHHSLSFLLEDVPKAVEFCKRIEREFENHPLFHHHLEDTPAFVDPDVSEQLLKLETVCPPDKFQKTAEDGIRKVFAKLQEGSLFKKYGVMSGKLRVSATASDDTWDHIVLKWHYHGFL